MTEAHKRVAEIDELLMARWSAGRSSGLADGALNRSVQNQPSRTASGASG